MSAEDAIAALERLGLSNYEASVFVALQRLGTGTAETVSDVSAVPRSQVYGAADDLAARGLIEVIESSPKKYRPVSLSTAREQLSRRLEQRTEEAFETLDSIAETEPPRFGGQDLSTLRGRHPIHERIADLVDGATESVSFVTPATTSLTDTIVTALRERAAAGIEVTVLTAETAVEDRFEDDPVRVVLMDEDNPADFAGRALLVDGTTVLLAVSTQGGPVEEEAVWTADTSIGRILAQFMQSGMDSGVEGEGPPDAIPSNHSDS